MLRVHREWVLARSAPASPLARACALLQNSLASDAALRVSGLLHCEPVELVAWLPTPKLQPLQTHVTAVALMYCILYTHSPSLTVGLDNAY